MKYAVCTNVIQGERKRIVSATIRLIIHRRTRIIIVQFLRNIARTIVIRAATCHRPVSYLRTCNFFCTVLTNARCTSIDSAYLQL